MHIKMAPMAAALLLAMAPAAAPAQSLLQSFRNLKNSINQLSRPAKPAGAATDTAASPAPTTESATADEAAMVPAIALTEDSSDSRLEATGLTNGRVRSFDVLGFKLGMSPREVSRIASRRGIHRGAAAAQLSGSFDLEATSLANVQLNKAVIRHSPTYLATAFGTSNRGESFIFSFTLEPTGPKLSRLVMEAKLNGQTPEQVRSALFAKYGKPGEDWRWCDGSCSNVLGPPSSAHLDYNIFGSTLTLTLDAGKAYATGAQKALEARAQQIAAKHGDGVRF